MQKKNDIVVGKPSVALSHLFANENLNSRIKSVDLHVAFNNTDLLGDGGSTASKHSQERDDRFFHIVPPPVAYLYQPLCYPHIPLFPFSHPHTLCLNI